MNELATILQPENQPKWPGDDDLTYEIVNGQRVELPPMSAYETLIASTLVQYFGAFPDLHKIGRAVAEMLFILDAEGKLRRRPDVAFVSFQRWPQNRSVPRTPAWDVVPELAVEVVSQTNLADEIVLKIQDYFRAGVQAVWVVYSVVRQIYVYESPNRIRVLLATDELDGGTVLPGFRLPVSALFEQE